MKIPIRSIPATGALDLKQKFEIDALDLSGDIFTTCEPVLVEAKASKGINTVSVKVAICGAMEFACSRCLKKFKWPFKKNAKFNFEINPQDLFLDIDENIREEIILDFPVKPLCKAGCKGLCLVCGEDLNLGKCVCKKK